MNLSIKLDQKALDTLFPEGSEARVKLQNGVVSAFTKTVMAQHVPADIKAHIEQQSKQFAKDVAAAVEQARDNVAAIAEREMGVTSHKVKSSWGETQYEMRLSDATKKAIDAAVTETLNENVRTAIVDAITSRCAALLQPGEAYDAYIDKAVKRMLEGEILQRVQAALAPINVKGL